MKTEYPGFPEYGYGGDMLGARRARRSFRLCVSAMVVLTLLLWFSERYLRYELTECQYIAALTLEPESARAVLRQVVKRDAELYEKPTVKYLAALAEREERGEILPVYEKAYRLAPQDVDLCIRYGCKLFAAERYAEARERFREAGLQAPGNGLPGYLEAAAAAFAANENLGEALALVAKTNAAGAPVRFPGPLWSQNLPTRGVWYSRLRRAGVDECCGPLYRLVDLAAAQAAKAVAEKQPQEWMQRMAALQTMGVRIADGKSGNEEDARPGTLQAAAGVRFERTALERMEALAALDDPEGDATLITQRKRVDEALGILNGFEGERDGAITKERFKYAMPLHLAWKSTLILFLACGLARLLCRLMRARRDAMSLAHLSAVPYVVVLGGASLFVLLLAIRVAGSDLVLPLAYVWWGVLSALVLFGASYPQLRLASPNAVAAAHGVAVDDAANLKLLRRGRRDASLNLWARYYGLLLGTLLCVLACWTIAFRIIYAVYPWQLEVLVTGMENEEASVFHQAARVLASL